MSDLTTVFTKVFVREFYRLNAGFFIVIITLTFGFMSGREHKALAEFFVASPVLSLIPIAVWVIYTVKIILFNKQRLLLPENIFLFNTSIVSYPQQLFCAMQASFVQFAPVVLYGIFLTVIALKHSLFGSLITIVCAMMILLMFSAFVLVQGLKTPLRESKTSTLKKFIDQHAVRPLWWIYIVTVLRQEPFLFVGTKIFTGLLLFAVTQLYVGETYDERLLAMAATFAGIGNYMVMMQLQFFDFRYFILMRSLPIHLFRRWITIALVTLILILPEIIVIIKYAPSVAITDLISVLVLIPALALVTYALLYFKFESEETYGRITFALAITHVVLILFQVPVFLFVIVNFGGAWLIFRSRYYQFEVLATAQK